MKKRITLAILILFSGYVFAQQEENTPKHSVKGTISDTSGHTLSNVAVIVMNATDTTSIAWEYSDKEGRFQVQYPKQSEKLLLYLQAYGYQSRYLTLRNDLPHQELGRVVLQPLHLDLNSVTVKGYRDIKQQFVRGRDEFEIPQELGESKYDIYTLLAEIPGLNVEGEKVEVIGRNGGVKFTINGLEPRPGELRDLPPGDVAKVYVDRMPSARYDKSITGVIDIVTRKKLSDYLSMRVGNNFYMNHEPSNFTFATINGKFNRLSTHLSGTYNYNRYYKEMIESYTLHLNGRDIERKSQHIPLFISHLPSLTFSPKYQINDKSFIDLQYYYQNDNGSSKVSNDFEMAGVETSITNIQDSEHGTNHNLQLRYVYGMNSTNRLVLNAGYAGNRRKLHSMIDERVTSVDSTVKDLYTDYRSRTTNDAFTFSADYEREWTKAIAFQAGVSFGEIWNTVRQDYAEGTSTRAETEETQAALYADFDHQVGKFNYRIGLRGEYLYKHHAGDNKANDRPFLFVPSIDVSYAFNKQTALSLYYRRSSTLPSLGQRNGVLTYINKYEYDQGNPDLKPYVKNEFYLGARLPHKLSINLNYQIDENFITDMNRIYDADKLQTLTTYANFPHASTLSAQISWRKTWKWYTLMLDGSAFKSWAKPVEIFGNFKPDQPVYSMRVIHWMKITPNIATVVSFKYRSAGEQFHGSGDERYSLSANLDMSFFKRRLHVYIACDNILYNDYHGWQHYQDITSETIVRTFDRRLSVKISYTLKNFINWFKQNDSNADVLKRLD